MIIRIFFRPVFSFQLNLNNTDEETIIMRTPITIISIDKIIYEAEKRVGKKNMKK